MVSEGGHRQTESSASVGCKRQIISTLYKPLEDFSYHKENTLQMSFQFNTSDLVSSTEILAFTDTGLKIVGSFLRHLVKAHSKGKSWGGSWNISDVFVIDGCCCVINKKPHLDSERENILADFKCALEVLYGIMDPRSFPPYFTSLVKLMENPPQNIDTDEASKIKYLEKVLNHVTFASNERKLYIFVHFGNFYKKLDGQQKAVCENSFNRNIKVDGKLDWIKNVYKEELLNQVYTNNRKRKSVKEPYGKGLLGLSIFLRNFYVHSLEKMVDDKGMFVMEYEKKDMIIAYYFEDFLPKLIFHLLDIKDQYPLLQPAFESLDLT